MNILITSAGRRVSLLQIFQREARNIDAASKIFATDLQPELSAACQVADSCFDVPEATDPDYVSLLTDICTNNKIDLLIPNIDIELLIIAQNKGTLEEIGVKTVISDPELIETCHDKRQTIGFFKEMNISTPQILDKKNFQYPVYAKPYDGSGSQENYIIKDETELEDYHLDNEKLLFFEYLDHDTHDEFTLDLYYDRQSELKCVVPRKRLKVIEGEVNKGLTIKNELIPFVWERLSYIPGARGCLTLQLFRNRITGKISGIELNPRFGGGYPLSYRAGANYPKWLIKEYILDQPVRQFDNWENNLLMLRYDAEVIVHSYDEN